MSNAEEKSRKASTDMSPLLRERNRSLTTFRRAVSVLRPGRYADLHVLHGLCELMLEDSLDRASFSSILAIKHNLETGR